MLHDVRPADVVPLPAANRDFHLTDVGNAERLVARHGPDLHYCHPWSRWFHFNGQRWAPDQSGEAVRRMKETLRQLLADLVEIDDDDERTRLTKHVLASEREVRMTAALSLARSEPGIPVLPGELDVDPWLLNVANGTIDLRTGDLRPHSRDDLITKLAAHGSSPPPRQARDAG